MPYCVGLTGTIASGKTTASRYFASMGISIINADEIARALVEPGERALLEIQAHFGTDILTGEGTLNRRKLREHIIHHPLDKLWLEAYLHPQIRHEIEKRILASTTAYTVIEIPLLKSRRDYPYLDRVLLIRSTRSKQISRMIKRDLCTSKEAIALLDLQKEHAENHSIIADDTIQNDTTLDTFISKLDIAHHFYLSAAKNKLMSSSVKEVK
jgi:dephospho-CoA kinase